ncbi:DNA repair protein XRCC4-like isoform X2 [Neltuma alba]|uniref:DNA repair protein XRCC4-like isoform X2 n=1 Tax=Neltuma alba TaxID=207710 RepID=UPI0010A38F6B|nr:DNA repair protein XRCC4-like isoform X2 [Prosopis alba]
MKRPKGINIRKWQILKCPHCILPDTQRGRNGERSYRTVLNRRGTEGGKSHKLSHFQILIEEDDNSGMEAKRHTCLKLQLPNTGDPTDAEPIFVKGTWYDTRFDLSITDGFNAWVCHASEEEVKERATQWDQPVSEYVRLAEQYLGFQQPDSIYGFADAGDGHKRLSWTFEKEGTKLQWRWKCQQSPNSKKTTAEILDFLMDANITLSEEVVRKTESFERMKVEAEKCLSQSERFANEKVEFESEIYAKVQENALKSDPLKYCCAWSAFLLKAVLVVALAFPFSIHY